MKIAELSERSGTPSSSIKYYVREGLLPEPERLGYNQSEYGQTHLARLRLLRALIGTGGLSVAAAREVLAAIEEPDASLVHVMRVSQAAVSATAHPGPGAVAHVMAAADARGWRVHDSNPGTQQCAAVLEQFEEVGHGEFGRELLESYAEPVLQIARTDVGAVAARAGSEHRAAEIVVLGTALGDALITGLRRMAQEHVSHETYLEQP